MQGDDELAEELAALRSGMVLACGRLVFGGPAGLAACREALRHRDRVAVLAVERTGHDLDTLARLPLDELPVEVRPVVLDVRRLLKMVRELEADANAKLPDAWAELVADAERHVGADRMVLLDTTQPKLSDL